MYPSLLPFFQWLNQLPWNPLLRESTWIVATNNLVHLLSVMVFTGAVVIVDLRLLGRGLTKQPLAQVARGAQPWLIGGLLGLLVTGFFALAVNAMVDYRIPVFWVKMDALLLALIFTFTVRRKVALADEARVGPVWAKLVALVSIALWTGVVMSARLMQLL